MWINKENIFIYFDNRNRNVLIYTYIYNNFWNNIKKKTKSIIIKLMEVKNKKIKEREIENEINCNDYK